MNTVEDFIYSHEGSQRETMLYFHQLLVDLNLHYKISYGIPFYYGKKWICYLNPKKNGSVDLAFLKGNRLSNSQGILKDKGRKMVSSIEVESLNEAPLGTINEVIHEAILLDKEIK